MPHHRRLAPALRGRLGVVALASHRQSIGKIAIPARTHTHHWQHAHGLSNVWGMGVRRGANVLTIGNFDGVHLGHVALVRRAREAADSTGGKVIALAFDPHPFTLLRPQDVPARLSTFEQRADLLRAAGADEVVRLEPTPQQLAQSAEAFIDEVVTKYEPGAFVEGSDFHFGKGRAGNVETLRAWGTSRGFDVHVVDPVEVALSDQHVIRASSSLIRWLLEQGRVQDAALVLGRDYQLTGEVVRGDRRGRDLGFPTANIRTACALPLGGVYAAIATLPDGRTFPAAVSVGPRPTFNAPEPRLEAFLMLPSPGKRGEPVPGLPEYGWTLSLSFRAFLREQLKFDSLPQLIHQMARDCDRALQMLAHPAHAEERGTVLCP